MPDALPIIGIDPGAHGAVAYLSPDGGHIYTRPLNTGDPAAVVALAREWLCGPPLVVVERNHPIPGMGTVAAFTFGRGFGVLLGVLASCGVAPVVVSAQVWRRWALGGKVPKDRKGRDAATVAAAVARWPAMSWPAGKAKREAAACAAMIAAWGRGEAR